MISEMLSFKSLIYYQNMSEAFQSQQCSTEVTNVCEEVFESKVEGWITVSEPGRAVHIGAEWGGTGPFESGVVWVETFRGGGGATCSWVDNFRG